MRSGPVMVLAATLIFAGCGPHVVRLDADSGTGPNGTARAGVDRRSVGSGGGAISDSLPSPVEHGSETVSVPEPDIPRVPASSVVGLGDRDGSARYHEVRTGETLWGIAKQEGVTLDALLRANGLTRSSVLQPGQLLYIPEPSGSRRRESPKTTITP